MMSEDFDERVRRGLQRRAQQVTGPDGDVIADVHRRARRQRRSRGAAAAVAALVVLGAGVVAAQSLVGGPDVTFPPADRVPAPTGTPQPGRTGQPETPAATATCQGAEHGVAYRVRYPAGWWASDGTDAEACRWFHPEPFDMPDAPRDLPEVAIMVRVSDRPLEQARDLDRERNELVSEDERTVDGRRAVVQEYVLAFDGIYPEGTTIYRYLVDVGERTLSGTTADADVVQADFADSRAALDVIMGRLEVLATSPEATGGEDCSAAGLDADLPAREGLPAAVADTRRAIAAAAVACDYDRLADLADEPFTYSFGSDGAFADFLRRQEAAGEEPLRYLVELLGRPHATVDTDRGPQYVWPSAFAYDDWAAVPEDDRDALKPLYDEQDFAAFEQFGGYIGYRVGIAADGRWRFFVAGD